MGRVIVEQIVSADGYGQDAAGGIDFFAHASWGSDVDAEQLRMLSGVGGIVLGARTYRTFADYWPSADPKAQPVAGPINELPKFVVSSTLESAPWGPSGSVEILRGEGVAAVRGLRQRIGGDLIIWGSLTLSDALFRAGEVDLLRLRVVPVLLGRGRSFVPADPGLRRLSLNAAQAFDGGLVALEYEVVADESE